MNKNIKKSQKKNINNFLHIGTETVFFRLFNNFHTNSL